MIRRPHGRLVRARRDEPLAASHALQARLPHEPLDGAAGDADALAAQQPPDLPGVVNAIENAAALRGNVAGCVVHSDRGSQFRSRKAIRALARHRMVGSMGRVGAAGDNAAMESFFSLLQKNVLNRRSWATREELRIAIVTWIERSYHRRRRQERLGRLTPVEFETMMTKTLVLAA